MSYFYNETMTKEYALDCITGHLERVKALMENMERSRLVITETELVAWMEKKQVVVELIDWSQRPSQDL
jgi:hypothetical protein